jgi:catechol 2,3-dioxygenase
MSRPRARSLAYVDPDGNGIELYRDRPGEEWPRTTDGEIAMVTRALDLESLLAELQAQRDPG